MMEERSMDLQGLSCPMSFCLHSGFRGLEANFKKYEHLTDEELKEDWLRLETTQADPNVLLKKEHQNTKHM